MINLASITVFTISAYGDSFEAIVHVNGESIAYVTNRGYGGEHMWMSVPPKHSTGKGSRADMEAFRADLVKVAKSNGINGYEPEDMIITALVNGAKNGADAIKSALATRARIDAQLAAYRR